MDQGLGDEVTPLGAEEGVRFQRKESEYSLKPESRDMLGPREMFIPVEGDYSQDPAEEFAVQEGKVLYRSVDNVNGSEQPHASSGGLDDAGVMVEELRVTNYNGSNLAIVGTSNYRERMQGKQSQWQHLYKLADGLGGGSSCGDTMYRDNSQTLSSFWEDMDCTPLAELSAQKPCADDHNDMMEQLTSAEKKGASGNNHGGIRTKILSKSGFSEFFVKQTLKGKGIICKGPPRDGFPAESKDQNNLKVASSTVAASDISPSLAPKTVMPSTDVIAALPSPDGISGPRTGGSDHDGVSLRQWLKVGRQKASKFECLYIFRQIVNVVDYYHSQGTALKDLRPSCFRLLPSNKVKFVGSPVRREMLESAMDQNTLQSDSFLVRKRPMKQIMLPPAALYAKKLKFSENKNFIGQWHQYPSIPGYKCETAYDSNANITRPQDSCTEYNEDNLTTQCETQSKSSSSSPFTSSMAQQQLSSLGDQLEEKWYTSPEEPSEGGCTISSNIYCLGVVLFEVSCCFFIY
nr:protein spa1-related 2 [Quercus suber]